MESWALDEIDRVCNGNTLHTPDRSRSGGEWDRLNAIPRRTAMRLTGAGFLTADGMAPDVFADMVSTYVADVTSTDDAVAWYVRHAKAALQQRRRINHHNRHERFARSKGHPTYYAYRRAVALEHGHGSFWHMRLDRGWSTGRDQ